MVENSSPKYQQIIWDWNGTILDDTQLILESINKTLAAREKDPITLSYLKNEIDFPITKFYEDLGIIETESDIQWLNNFYHDQYNPGVQSANLHQYVELVLQEAESLGVKQYILSARDQVALHEDVDFFGLTGFFTEMRGTELDKSYLGKLALAESLIDQSQSAVMIGDTLHDWEIADKLGIDCFLIPNGINSKERLENSSATVLNSHQDLLTHLFIS